tara:strand:+ start:2148 stop:3194 length:1047 start_codon:yes stop_codon:yes gene_type:complete
MFKTGEVVETAKAYKTKQRDEYNNLLYDGSIQVRVGSNDDSLAQIRTVWAAPAVFNKKMPLIGEQVLIFTSPGTEVSNADEKMDRWYYMNSYNSVDDVTLHNFPKFWKRSVHAKGSRTSSPGLNDKGEVGYTISKSVVGAKKLQPFEGDDLWEGRFGQSIRFTRHLTGENSPGINIYEKQPTWDGSTANDPLLIMRVNNTQTGEGYAIEDLSDDAASIYLASNHKLPKLQVGFRKNLDAIKIPNYSNSPQLVLDSSRIVINASTDKAFLIGKTQTVITAEKVLMQSKKHKVDLDDLMEWINSLAAELFKLTTAQAVFTSFTGPTGPATNSGAVTKIHKADFVSKFKVP